MIMTSYFFLFCNKVKIVFFGKSGKVTSKIRWPKSLYFIVIGVITYASTKTEAVESPQR